jgi:hypothetical protein
MHQVVLHGGLPDRQHLRRNPVLETVRTEGAEGDAKEGTQAAEQKESFHHQLRSLPIRHGNK